MNDTNTWAKRNVAGGELYLRKAPTAKRWEISSYFRDVNLRTAFADRVLLYEQLVAPDLFSRTFSSPDAAASALDRYLAA